jgi:hypothetical protein
VGAHRRHRCRSARSPAQSARQASVGPAARLEVALEGARTALTSGAWVGGGADDLSGDLDTHRRTVNQAGPDAIARFDSAVAALPEQVASDST